MPLASVAIARPAGLPLSAGKLSKKLMTGFATTRSRPIFNATSMLLPVRESMSLRSPLPRVKPKASAYSFKDVNFRPVPPAVGVKIPMPKVRSSTKKPVTSWLSISASKSYSPKPTNARILAPPIVKALTSIFSKVAKFSVTSMLATPRSWLKTGSSCVPIVLTTLRVIEILACSIA